MTTNTACLATYPKRRDQLEVTVKSLLPQMDEVRVYLNEYTEVPDFLNHSKVSYAIHGKNHGDAGKFWWLDKVVHGTIFICDDDIIYPPDYAERMNERLDHYKGKPVVGLHGVWINEPVTSYYKDRRKINFQEALDKDVYCHLLATNSIAVRAGRIKCSMRDFPVSNYADPFFAVLTQTQSIPCIAVSRQHRWLQQQTVSEELYKKFGFGDDALHTKIVKLLSPWRMHKCQ